MLEMSVVHLLDESTSNFNPGSNSSSNSSSNSGSNSGSNFGSNSSSHSGSNSTECLEGTLHDNHCVVLLIILSHLLVHGCGCGLLIMFYLIRCPCQLPCYNVLSYMYSLCVPE